MPDEPDELEEMDVREMREEEESTLEALVIVTKMAGLEVCLCVMQPWSCCREGALRCQ